MQRALSWGEFNVDEVRDVVVTQVVSNVVSSYVVNVVVRKCLENFLALDRKVLDRIGANSVFVAFFFVLQLPYLLLLLVGFSGDLFRL